MRQRILFFIAPVCSVFIALFTIWTFPGLLNVGQSGTTDKLTEEERRLLQDGDFILIQGTGFTGDLIVLALNEETKLSHCGVIVFRGREPWVVHTISPGLSGIDGVQTHDLEEFSSKAQPSSIIIARPLWEKRYIEEDGGKRTAARALFYLARQVPFDNVFDFESREKMYCTELLYQILDDNGFWEGRDRPALKGAVLPFNAFLDTESFSVIINHQQGLNQRK